MTPDADSLWAKSVRALQRLKGLEPITREEADALLSQTEEFAASDEEIDALVKRVAAGKSLPLDYEPDMSWLDAAETNQVENELRILNRNACEVDEATKKAFGRFENGILG